MSPRETHEPQAPDRLPGAPISEPDGAGRDRLSYLLTAYLFDSLSEEGRREVEEQLEASPELREEFEAYRGTLDLMEDALEVSGPGAAGGESAPTGTYSFDERRRERILQAARRQRALADRPPVVRFVLTHPVLVASLSSAAALLLVAAFIFPLFLEERSRGGHLGEAHTPEYASDGATEFRTRSTFSVKTVEQDVAANSFDSLDSIAMVPSEETAPESVTAVTKFVDGESGNDRNNYYAANVNRVSGGRPAAPTISPAPTAPPVPAAEPAPLGGGGSAGGVASVELGRGGAGAGYGADFGADHEAGSEAPDSARVAEISESIVDMDASRRFDGEQKVAEKKAEPLRQQGKKVEEFARGLERARLGTPQIASRPVAPPPAPAESPVAAKPGKSLQAGRGSRRARTRAPESSVESLHDDLALVHEAQVKSGAVEDGRDFLGGEPSVTLADDFAVEVEEEAEVGLRQARDFGLVLPDSSPADPAGLPAGPAPDGRRVPRTSTRARSAGEELAKGLRPDAGRAETSAPVGFMGETRNAPIDLSIQADPAAREFSVPTLEFGDVSGTWDTTTLDVTGGARGAATDRFYREEARGELGFEAPTTTFHDAGRKQFKNQDWTEKELARGGERMSRTLADGKLESKADFDVQDESGIRAKREEFLSRWSRFEGAEVDAKLKSRQEKESQQQAQQQGQQQVPGQDKWSFPDVDLAVQFEGPEERKQVSADSPARHGVNRKLTLAQESVVKDLDLLGAVQPELRELEGVPVQQEEVTRLFSKLRKLDPETPEVATRLHALLRNTRQGLEKFQAEKILNRNAKRATSDRFAWLDFAENPDALADLDSGVFAGLATNGRAENHWFVPAGDSRLGSGVYLEKMLAAFHLFREKDPGLSFDDFAARPRHVPPPRPGDEGLGREEFRKRYRTNPFIDPRVDRFSTFSMDVDTASFTRTAAVLASDQLPPPETVRVEEFVNAIPQDYPEDPSEVFTVTCDGMPSPFATGGVDLLRVGIRARNLQEGERRPAVLTLAVDTSGSMARSEHLDLIKSSLEILVEKLEPTDRVALVAYSDQANLILPHTPARQAERIIGALGSLRPRGGTNVEAGLDLAYRIAHDALSRDSLHRVILVSDGVANVGARDPEKILEKIRVFARRGIYLTTVGVGSERYDDRMLERLANEGNGNYAYVASVEEAARLFEANLPSTLEVLAEDAKIQVEFQPEAVSAYRLLGYENRDIADRDFRNDKVDAAEVGPGSTVTALYEVVRRPGWTGPVGKVFVRYRDVASRRVEERDFPIPPGIIAGDARTASESLAFLACVAELAEILRESYYARDGSLGELLARLGMLPDSIRQTPSWKQVATMTGRAFRLRIQSQLARLKEN